MPLQLPIVIWSSVARNFEQKVAKFLKTPKDLHQTIKALLKTQNIQSSSKRPKYLHQSTKRKSQNRFKTGLKPVFSQISKSSQKSGQKGQVAEWSQK